MEGKRGFRLIQGVPVQGSVADPCLGLVDEPLPGTDRGSKRKMEAVEPSSTVDEPGMLLCITVTPEPSIDSLAGCCGAIWALRLRDLFLRAQIAAPSSVLFPAFCSAASQASV